MTSTHRMAASIEPMEHVEHLDNLRATINHRLVAIDGLAKRIESQSRRRASRAFVRYLVAIVIGVAATLAWQSYGDAIKQTIAINAPELGWSPETRKMIASWVQDLGWTTPRADTAIATAQPSVLRTTQAATLAPGTAAPGASVAASLDVEKVQQITSDLAALRQTVEQLAAGQDQMSRGIQNLQAAEAEILLKIPTTPPPTAAAAPRKPLAAPPAPPAPRASLPAH